MKRSTIFEIQSGELSNKRQRQTLPVDQIIQNPAFQQLFVERKPRIFEECDHCTAIEKKI